MYIYIYIYIYIDICIGNVLYLLCIIFIYSHIYNIYNEGNIFVVKKTGNVPSRLLPIRQSLRGNPCPWAHDLGLQCTIGHIMYPTI